VARRSQWSAVIAETKKREGFFQRRSYEPFPPGFGLSYGFLPLPPAGGPLAYLFRRFVSFWDALREWRVQLPPRDTEFPEHQRGELTSANETIPFRREAADRILAALEEPTEQARAFCERPEVLARFYGGSREKCLAEHESRRDNYDAAERTLRDWCRQAKREAGQDEDRPVSVRLRAEGGNPLDKSPKLRVAWELENTVQPLMWAYRDPAKFFREIAPVAEWPNFDAETIGPFDHFACWGALGNVLHEWGVAALLNPNVRAAFDAATPYKLMHILGQADAKGAFGEGRKKGSKDKRPRKPKPPQLRQEERDYLRELAQARGPLDDFEKSVLQHLQDRGFKWRAEKLTEVNLRDFARFHTSSVSRSKK
jgi:hypothetical protein